MATLPSRPTREKLLAFIEASNLEYATIGFVDYQGTVRGKYVSRNKLLSALDKMSFPLVSLALDPTDAILLAPGIAEAESGFADASVRLLPETARLILWERAGRDLFILSEFIGEAEKYCPRAVYRRIYDQAEAMGMRPVHAVECEFTLFNETAGSAAAKGYRNLEVATPHKTYYSLVRQGVQAEFYNELMDMAQSMRIPLESLHEEMSDGFMEVAIQHGNDAGVPDSAALFKTFAKIVAQRNNKLISFMARWSTAVDGQSGHIHASLTDLEGNPLFHDAGDPDGMSRTMKYFIGGMQALMGDFMIMLAPNINSFKRLVPGIFAPISAEWGIENRTCAIRAIPGSPSSSRVECRTPGADANPYLSIAAIVAAGLHGIREKIEPTEPTVVNAYDLETPEALRFPTDFKDAIQRFHTSEQARAWFGAAFVDAYAGSRMTQLEQFAAMVTDRELERFFELV